MSKELKDRLGQRQGMVAQVYHLTTWEIEVCVGGNQEVKAGQASLGYRRPA